MTPGIYSDPIHLEAMWGHTGDKIGENKIAKSLIFSDLAI